MDCQYIKCWLSGNGGIINPQTLVDIISSRNSQELKLMRQAYIRLYNEDMLLVLSTRRRNDIFANVVYLRISEPQDRDAEILRDALTGESANLNVLIEMVCTRSTSELHHIKQAYQFKYDTDVEKDIALKTDSGHREILLAILKSSTNKYGGKADMSMAMCDAKTLFEALESGESVDWKTIILLVSERNTQQLKSILISYEELYGNEFSKSLKRKKCGKFGKELRVVVGGLQYPEKFIIKQLCIALQSRVDARDALIRVIVTRLELDIKDINNAFSAKTGWSLENFIRREFNNVVGSCNSNANKVDAMVAEFLLALLKKRS